MSSGTPATVYLDTNAIDYLITKSRSESNLRARAFEAKARRKIRFVGSVFHVEELARMSEGDPAGYRERIRLFFQLCGAFVLLPTNQLTQAEVRQRGQVFDPDCYLPFRTILIARALAENQGKARELGELIYQGVVSNRDRARGLREQVRQKLSRANLDVVRATRGWWKRAEPNVAEWLKDYLRSSRALLGLPEDESNWPDPMTLPTPRRMYSYAMARIALTVGENRKIADGDLHDAHHFAAAGYADVLVTDDGPMRSTIATIPNRPDDPALMSFDAFVADVL